MALPQAYNKLQQKIISTTSRKRSDADGEKSLLLRMPTEIRRHVWRYVFEPLHLQPPSEEETTPPRFRCHQCRPVPTERPRFEHHRVARMCLRYVERLEENMACKKAVEELAIEMQKMAETSRHLALLNVSKAHRAETREAMACHSTFVWCNTSSHFPSIILDRLRVNDVIGNKLRRLMVYLAIRIPSARSLEECLDFLPNLRELTFRLGDERTDERRHFHPFSSERRPEPIATCDRGTLAMLSVPPTGLLPLPPAHTPKQAHIVRDALVSISPAVFRGRPTRSHSDNYLALLVKYASEGKPGGKMVVVVQVRMSLRLVEDRHEQSGRVVSRISSFPACNG